MGLLSSSATILEAACARWLGCDPVVALVATCIVVALWKTFARDVLSGYGRTPHVHVEAEEEAERYRVLTQRRLFDYTTEWGESSTSIPCWDPSTMEYLGEMPVKSPGEVGQMVARARVAQQRWMESSFAQRRQLLRVLQQCILQNASTIATVACRESGKTMIDAMVGELAVTLEKLRWTASNGERYLKPEYRESGLMNLHKTSRVEWRPVGVVGAIVPWNYPFHNVLNPLIAALFAGNAIVIKVSEYASWSTRYYGRVIQACLTAVGAPPDLVQIATGYADTGAALVEHVDKLIFVGSINVGRKVMEIASRTLTPVILELGGKDPFIVCDDADPATLAQLVVRGAFQNMGQNCAGPERFLVYDKVYDDFCKHVVDIVKQLRQGPPLSSDFIDCGACVHPPSLAGYQRFVDDAASRGARILTGGGRNKEFPQGQFFEPTVLADVTEDMLIAKEETFGPILAIFRVKNNSDDEAVRIANSCDFKLSSCAFSGDHGRAASICSRLEAGMSSINDIEGTTYLSQSLPFGGLKSSGFGRFAGPEGLRGLCHERSVVENRVSFLKVSIPRPIAYPANGHGVPFCLALNQILYGGLSTRLRGVLGIVKACLPAKEMPNKGA
eukprot:TRINITY_DN3967_c0_g1_i1.p1 TRINITY_DN3967_c0_g1~~TRINITY_DN3967_c0_g1_i1.p1  ORF type:complete len:615 (+),score=89.27 TRINITY_DN3967_c0_g1_i1:77-1921(+)